MMRDRWTAPAAALLAGLLLAATSASRGAGLADLPINRWTKLETQREGGYTFSRPVYVPSRGQVLHWGAVRGGDYRPWMRNDVRAFDAEAGRWTSDYPRAEKLPGLRTHSSSGKGVSHLGTGEMLGCGTPAPSHVVDGVCYDSRRDQVLYTMKGLMAAYDPKARKWRDMKARCVLDGVEHPGGPPIYGVAACYDPIHDEIVLFPHWGGQNTDLREATGRLSAHWGTFVYSFRDNTWRRISDTFGSEEVRRRRKEVIARLGQISRELDEAWLAGGPKRRSKPADVGAAELPAKLLGELRELEAALDGPLRVEPPPRCGTPPVYDPKSKAIVMFGGQDSLVRTDLGPSGQPGALNDTWLYDVTTRQWRELPCRARPPETLWPRLVYDPASGQVLLVDLRRARSRKDQARVTIWGLDVAKAQWSRLHEQPWPWDIGRSGGTGWSTELYEVALDEKHALLLLMQNLWQDDAPVEQVFAFRLDAGRLKATPAPEWHQPPPVKPVEIPPDDPKWVARLKSLPANRWVHARPPREPADRGWGIAACDPVRGWMVYFGGGHATYQVNNVAVYVVGANRWATTAGDHNDYVPPVGWGGVAMGFRGGPHAHHMRNEYVALDGRVFRSMGTASRRWGAEAEKRPPPRYAWFHDVDRGGVWRQVRIARLDIGEKVPGTYGRPCCVHPDGRVFGFGGGLEPYDGRFFAGESYFSVYDVYRNTLSIRRIEPPVPGIVYECRPFCTLGDRDQIFFYECVARQGKIERQGTWVFDVKTSRFSNLHARRHPPDEPGTVLYLEHQDAVWAAIGRDQQWVYSFRHNTWAPLPLESDSPLGFDPVYTQVVYAAKYGVLVGAGSASRGTAVMRPDVRAARWGAGP
jgi:hypothetical protein